MIVKVQFQLQSKVGENHFFELFFSNPDADHEFEGFDLENLLLLRCWI